MDFNILHLSPFLLNIRPTLDRGNPKGACVHSDRKNWVPQRQKAALHQYSSNRITASLATNESPHYKDLIFKKWNIAPRPPLLGIKQKTLQCLQGQTLSGATTAITCVIHVSCSSHTFGTEEELKINFNMSFTLLYNPHERLYIILTHCFCIPKLLNL